MTVAKLTEGLYLNNSEKQNTAKIRKSLENSFCYYKQPLRRDKKENLVIQTSMQDF